tara:strand:- start:1795 stop:2046 length:252 start_codon:yes stop_codon:yes gene_type:complete|eukprot:COSAG01_NODE_682_length_14262_cov_11.120949_9_plen_84_part_00
MKSKKLSKKELQTLQEYQTKTNEILSVLGSIELQFDALKTQKEEVLKEFKTLTESQTKTGKELQDKYGEGNINLEDGEFTPKE